LRSGDHTTAAAARSSAAANNHHLEERLALGDTECAVGLGVGPPSDSVVAVLEIGSASFGVAPASPEAASASPEIAAALGSVGAI
jgi:hypothetical protein